MKRELVLCGLALAVAATGPAWSDARPREKAKVAVRKMRVKKSTARKTPAKAAPKRPAPAAFDEWLEGGDGEATQAVGQAKVTGVAATGGAVSRPTRVEPQKPTPRNADGSPRTGVNLNPATRNARESAETIGLARDGKALQPIIVSATATPAIRAAAEDLRKYLNQMTGATFEIKTGDGTMGIVLGTAKEFPVPALNKALEIVHGFDGKEAYAIRTTGKRLLLLGATAKGASHAAYRFLDELGCRWYFPDSTGNWQIIPRAPELKFGRDITDRPAFLSRTIWYAWSLFNDAGHPRRTPQDPRTAETDYADWMRRNHMAESFVVNAGHALFHVIAENQAEFDKHPEYYALTGGKRQGAQIELGNPKVREMVVNYARNYFRKNPEADMISVDPADGGGYSESEESKKLGSPTDAIFGMANEVARMLQKEFPGKMVGLYAYNWHSDPPSFALEPNVYVQLTMGFNAGLLTLNQLFEEWPRKARNLGFYDYYSTWRWDYDMWPGGRIAAKSYAPSSIRRFQEANARAGTYATSISAESSNNWGVNGRGYVLASRLMWNPQLDENAILEDFYRKAFGPAASAMKRYYALQDDVPPISPGVVGALFRRMKEARDAAKDDAAVMRRLNDLTSYLRYYDLNYRQGREADAAKKEARALEIQTLMYRNRYSYMNHWEAFRQDSIKQDYNPTAPTPWKVDKPITHEEIEGWVEDALRYYPELNVPPQTAFSREVVPVNLGGEPKEFVSPTYQAGSPQYTLYSVRGEPIRATLISFNVYGGEKLSYELRAANGKVLAQGTPKGSGGKGTETVLNVPVPAPGPYYLSYTDGSGSMYGLKIPAGQPFAFDMSTIAGSTLYNSTPDLYFYVPKGVKSIEYYFVKTDWSNSGPHTVIDPTGTVQATFLDKNGDYISVPVPPGMDGKAWRFGSPKDSPQGFGLGRFHFFNCPNLLSPSSATMLVPKDVAEKDGLKVVQ